jgi:serine O-acetyltransferase
MNDKKRDIPDLPKVCEEQQVCLTIDDVNQAYRDELPAAVEAIVESCRGKTATLAHNDSTLLPSKDEVTRLIHLMLEIVYPGYFAGKEVDLAALPYHIGSISSELMDRLAVQIGRSIRHECRRTRSLCSHCIETGHKHAVAFLKALPEVRRLAAGDVRAAYRADPAAKSFDEIIFCYPGLFAITVQRLAHVLHDLGVPVLPRIMTEYAHGQTGIDIHPGATIAEEFFVDHGTGVVIGETTVIGHRVTIYQGVTLGALSFQRDEEGALVRGTKRHPTIEDDVVIYAGATILGGGTVVGKGCVIGGNVWLTHSVPPGTKVTISNPELVFRTSQGEGA